MSTIIIPGGASFGGTSVISLAANLLALYVLVRVAMYMYSDLNNEEKTPGEMFNVVEFLKKFNIDASGLFAPKISV